MIRSKKEMYKQIYKVTYLANINGMIAESRFIDVLQKISSYGFKTYHINNFDRLTMYMENIGLTDSFNISILLYLRDTHYKKISTIAINFEEIGKVFSNKRKRMIDRVYSICKILKKKNKSNKIF